MHKTVDSPKWTSQSLKNVLYFYQTLRSTNKYDMDKLDATSNMTPTSVDYTKSDMVYKGYSWELIKSDQPKDNKTDLLLNRYNGHQVLDFINKIAKTLRLSKKAQVNKLEEIIQKEVPPDLTSRQEIQKWIIENWKKQ